MNVTTGTMVEEGANMNKPSWFSNNLTLGNVLTLVAMLSAGAYGYGQLTERIDGRVSQVAARIDAMELFRVERVRQTDAKFADIAAALQALPNLVYRVAANEEALKGTNQRIEASLATVNMHLAEINEALGSLDTKVAVLTQRIETNTSQRRADASGIR